MNSFENIPFKRTIVATGLTLSLGGLAAACGGSQEHGQEHSTNYNYEDSTPLMGAKLKVIGIKYANDHKAVESVSVTTPVVSGNGNITIRFDTQCVKGDYSPGGHTLLVGDTGYEGAVKSNSPVCADEKITKPEIPQVLNSAQQVIVNENYPPVEK